MSESNNQSMQYILDRGLKDAVALLEESKGKGIYFSNGVAVLSRDFGGSIGGMEYKFYWDDLGEAINKVKAESKEG